MNQWPWDDEPQDPVRSWIREHALTVAGDPNYGVRVPKIGGVPMMMTRVDGTTHFWDDCGPMSPVYAHIVKRESGWWVSAGIYRWEIVETTIQADDPQVAADLIEAAILKGMAELATALNLPFGFCKDCRETMVNGHERYCVKTFRNVEPGEFCSKFRLRVFPQVGSR